ncbi:MAG: hypothetical protein WCS57_05795 [Bacillota bacterium]
MWASVGDERRRGMGFGGFWRVLVEVLVYGTMHSMGVENYGG